MQASPKLAIVLLAGGTVSSSTLGAQRSTVPRDSAAFASGLVLHPHNGLTPADIIGDGSAGVILVAMKENYNAHGYHAVAIAVRPRVLLRAAPPDSDWKLVPVEGPARGGGDVLGTEEGADCTLRDMRLVRVGQQAPLTLIIGQRALTRSYADSDEVQFSVYELRHNVTGVVGHATYYFEPARVIRPTKQYCDINAAFDQELGLGRNGIARAEGADLNR